MLTFNKQVCYCYEIWLRAISTLLLVAIACVRVRVHACVCLYIRVCVCVYIVRVHTHTLVTPRGVYVGMQNNL